MIPMSPVDQEMFIAFLLDAKRATYASTGGEAVVEAALAGAHQLEYRAGPFLYRDIYYGGEQFIGQETVYQGEQPLWSMSYAGWSIDASIPVGDFLKEALRHVEADRPFRGPPRYQNGDYTYANESHGAVARFWGCEVITYQDRPIYELRYQGGTIR
ncbi:MAG: hypothetical protein JW966_13160 [Anaerolineae bacterium]|nr:hypothetical protein [Anaerolineae bacterium]